MKFNTSVYEDKLTPGGQGRGFGVLDLMGAEGRLSAYAVFTIRIDVEIEKDARLEDEHCLGGYPTGSWRYDLVGHHEKKEKQDTTSLINYYK